MVATPHADAADVLAVVFSRDISAVAELAVIAQVAVMAQLVVIAVVVGVATVGCWRGSSPVGLPVAAVLDRLVASPYQRAAAPL